jgi:DNA-binding NarL/FixJ family response regulator
VTEPIRLLIADDHPVVRDGLRDMLSSQPDFEVVAEAKNGAEAVALADRLKPHVVLTDLAMPQMDGVTAITQIKAQHQDIQILVLTSYDSDSDILRPSRPARSAICSRIRRAKSSTGLSAPPPKVDRC